MSPKDAPVDHQRITLLALRKETGPVIRLLDPITLRGRRCVDGKSFENRGKYAIIVTVQILDKVAYLRGMREDAEQGPVKK